MAGRKKKYDEKELINLMCNVVVKDPFFHLSPTSLEKATGVPIHIWKSPSYKRLQFTMKALSINVERDSTSFEIVNPADIIETHLGNPDQLLAYGNKLNMLINNLFEQLIDIRVAFADLNKAYEELLISSTATCIPDDTDDLSELIKQYNAL